MSVNKEILACKKCNDDIIVAPLGGTGNANADIVIVGQNTCTPKCLESGIPFTGGSGVILDDALAAVELTRDMVYITNVVKCATMKNQLPSEQMKQNCRPFLVRELAIIKPRLVITLGKFTAVGFPVGDYKVVHLKHPAFYLRSNSGEIFVREFIDIIQEWKN